MPGTTNLQKFDKGAIFDVHNVWPVPLAPICTANSLIPRFSWAVPQGGVSGACGETLRNDYGVQFFAGDDMHTILSTSLLHDTTFCDPNPAEWEIISDTPGPVYWYVCGGTTVAGYSTGPYWSDVLAFRVPSPATIWLLAQGRLLVALVASLRSIGSPQRQSWSGSVVLQERLQARLHGRRTEIASRLKPLLREAAAPQRLVGAPSGAIARRACRNRIAAEAAPTGGGVR
jgi:hypothetical protein